MTPRPPARCRAAGNARRSGTTSAPTRGTPSASSPKWTNGPTTHAATACRAARREWAGTTRSPGASRTTVVAPSTPRWGTRPSTTTSRCCSTICSAGSGWPPAWPGSPAAGRTDRRTQPLRSLPGAAAQPRLPATLGGPGQPGVLDDLGQFRTADPAEPARPDQHRRVAVEVRSREEGRRLVLDQRLLVRVRLHPEDDHVGIAFAGLRVDRVGARVAEEDER